MVFLLLPSLLPLERKRGGEKEGGIREGGRERRRGMKTQTVIAAHACNLDIRRMN